MKNTLSNCRSSGCTLSLSSTLAGGLEAPVESCFFIEEDSRVSSVEGRLIRVRRSREKYAQGIFAKEKEEEGGEEEEKDLEKKKKEKKSRK